MNKQPERSVDERLILDTTNEILALIPHIDGFKHSSINHKVDEIIRKTLTAERQKWEEVVEAERERIKTLWLDVQFLDKDSEDENYWNEKMGSNHCVEMHITDFERLRKTLTQPNHE